GRDEPASILRDPERSAQERLRRGRAEAHQDGRSHLFELGVQPRPARQLLTQIGVAMDPALASWCRLPPEMLDHVGHIDVGTIDPRILKARSRTPPAGPTNGWPSTSSRSPGCSPMSITRARSEPSPKTACVAL